MEAMHQPLPPRDRPSFEDYMRYKGIYTCTLYTVAAISLQKSKTETYNYVFISGKECGTLEMQ
jgi:hypothetical protein